MARKATNRLIDQDYLDGRIVGLEKAGYGKPKWIEFCEVMLHHGLSMTLYEARQTVSKYITVRSPENGRAFKVRFSNHRPNYRRETEGDCDFFVGRTHLGVTTTVQAIKATLEFFELEAAA